jgi:hypothetical protein
MSVAVQSFVAKRAETLAREFLTRRPDVDLHPLDGDLIDFLVTLHSKRPLKSRDFMPFGVVVKGINDALASERDAARHIFRTSRKSGQGMPRYSMPVIAVLFSMADDSGYYAWLAEPRPDDGKLKLNRENLSSTRIQRDSLDDIVDRVYDWYDKFEDVMITSA